MVCQKALCRLLASHHNVYTDKYKGTNGIVKIMHIYRASFCQAPALINR
jgi:hypothetical protein